MSSAPSIAALLQVVASALAALGLGFASLRDIATRTIPDLIPAGLRVLGVAARLADHTALAALAASAAVFALGALCWRFGWVGGGDVKLLAACAWLASPICVPQLILFTALAGGALAALYLGLSLLAGAAGAPGASIRPRSVLARIARVEWWRIRHRASLPYGCAIATATLLTLYGW
jgi:prepilin peptidase CpaA